MNRLTKSILLVLLIFPTWIGADEASRLAEFEKMAETVMAKPKLKKLHELSQFAFKHRLWEKREWALREAIKLKPKDKLAHELLGEVKVGKEWIDAEKHMKDTVKAKEAKGLVQVGAKWVEPEKAKTLIAKTQDTVGWKCEHLIESEHTIIYSARPLDFTREIALLLDSEVRFYRGEYGPLWKAKTPKKKFIVYLMTDRKTFETQVNKFRSSPIGNATKGYYSYNSSKLYVGPIQTDVNIGKENMITLKALIVHEMIHGLDHQLAGINQELAIWVLEGRADYYGRSVSGHQIFPGFPFICYGDSTPETLDKGPVSISQLFSMNQKSFSGPNINVNYAYAEAAVYFLFHGEDGKHADGFRKYLKNFRKKHDKKTFKATVGKLSKIDPSFKKFITDVYRPYRLKHRKIKK